MTSPKALWLWDDPVNTAPTHPTLTPRPPRMTP